MSYSTSNPPALVTQRVGGGGAIWIYSDGDALADVNGVNYVSNAADIGLEAGDRVIHIDETNGSTTDLTAVAGATTGTAVGATGSAIEPIAETTVALSSAGTGTILIDDIITFDNDADGNEYRVTDWDTDVSDGGTITITPGLVKATADGTGINIKSGVVNLSSGVNGGVVLSGSAATRALTKAESGADVLFDTATGQIFTLPEPVVGLKYRFIVTTDLTSGAYQVDTDAGTTFIVGSILGGIEDAATDEAFFANGSTHVGISMNATTTGGLIGGVFTLTCISSTVWVIEGTSSCTATPGTPFTT